MRRAFFYFKSPSDLNTASQNRPNTYGPPCTYLTQTHVRRTSPLKRRRSDLGHMTVKFLTKYKYDILIPSHQRT